MLILIILFILYILLRTKISSAKIILLIVILFFIITFISKAVNKWTCIDDKYTIYTHIIEPYRLKSVEYNENIINYPFIIKPTICSGSNKGVKLIKNSLDLEEFKKTKCPWEKYMIQEFYPSKYEVGVLYEKIPYFTDGNIVSIVMKQRNGNKWEPLKCENHVNNGVNCSIRNDLITEDLLLTIRKIANNIPGFYMGRFDIGFNDEEEFKKGRNFKCFELNGVMGFDLRISRKDYGIKEIGFLIRWILVRILVGLINLLTTNALYFDIVKSYPISIQNYFKCQDYEKLFESCTA